jgi:hypothetical protein
MPLTNGYGVLIGKIDSYYRDAPDNSGKYYHGNILASAAGNKYHCAARGRAISSKSRSSPRPPRSQATPGSPSRRGCSKRRFAHPCSENPPRDRRARTRTGSTTRSGSGRATGSARPRTRPPGARRTGRSSGTWRPCRGRRCTACNEGKRRPFLPDPRRRLRSSRRAQPRRARRRPTQTQPADASL